MQIVLFAENGNWRIQDNGRPHQIPFVPEMSPGLCEVRKLAVHMGLGQRCLASGQELPHREAWPEEGLDRDYVVLPREQKG